MGARFLCQTATQWFEYEYEYEYEHCIPLGLQKRLHLSYNGRFSLELVAVIRPLVPANLFST